MAIWNPEFDQAGFEEWLATIPEKAQALARRFPPHRLYRLTPTGDRCVALAYCEDGTLTVGVSERFNRVWFPRAVSGVSAEDLEECELPGPDEPVGCVSEEQGYTPEEAIQIARQHIAQKRGELN